jgi:monothiol glutaredoxin
MIDVTKQRIEEKVKSGPIVIFMKGSPMLPQCGFSAQAVEALKRAGAEDIQHEDVRADPAVRQGIKDYTGWPTIPQVFIGGEFVGGADIVTELYRTGELAQRVEQAQGGAENASGA